jgi:hypothetical protein
LSHAAILAVSILARRDARYCGKLFRMSSQFSTDDREGRAQLAEAVRQACIAAALEAHEHAGIVGLCQEGRWEAAIEAVRSLDLRAVLRNSG